MSTKNNLDGDKQPVNHSNLETKLPQSFFEPNLSLNSSEEATAYYQQQKDKLTDFSSLDSGQKNKLGLSFLVEALVLQNKLEEDFIESDAFIEISDNFYEIYDGVDFMDVLIYLVDKEIDADISIVSFDSRELRLLMEDFGDDERKLNHFKKLISNEAVEPEEQEKVKTFISLNEELKKAQSSQGEYISEESVREFLESDFSSDFLEAMFLNINSINSESKEIFDTLLEGVSSSEIVNVCTSVIENSEVVVPELFNYLSDIDIFDQGQIITTLVKNNLFLKAKDYIPDTWDHDGVVTSLLFSRSKEKPEDNSIYDYIESVLETDSQKQYILRRYVLNKGYDAFFADERIQEILSFDAPLPKDWFLLLFSNMYYSTGKNVVISNQFAEHFPLPSGVKLSEILETNIRSIKNLEIPQIWKDQIGNMELDRYDAANLLDSVARGHLDKILSLGGEVLLTNLLEYPLTESSMYSVLEHSVESGWASTPEQIKEKIADTQWTSFPTVLFETNDIKLISRVVSKSKLSIKLLPETDNITAENNWFKGLFNGCSDSDIRDALDSDVFKTIYPDYVEYAENLVALGERALVVRCAVKDISLQEVEELIELARVQPHISYKTTAVLSGLHSTDIYWEDREDQTVEGLFWDKDLKEYIHQDQAELITVQSLRDFIVSQADPHSFESVFYLLNLAEKPDNEILKNSQQISQEDYKYIFDSLVGRTKSDLKVLKELGTRAGYEQPSDYKAALLDTIAGYPTASEISNVLELSEGTINVEEYKKIAFKYFDTEVRFSADTCKVLFDYAEEFGSPFTQAEKHEFWDKFVGDFKKKNNISTLGASEVEIFLDEEVIDQKEARQLLEKYLIFGSTNRKELTELLKLCLSNQDETEELLSHYVDNTKTISTVSLNSFHLFITENSYNSPEISQSFAAYLKEDIDFDNLTHYLETFEKHVNSDDIKNKTLSLIRAKKRISNGLVGISEKYGFSKDEHREICGIGLQDHTVHLEAYKHSYEESNFTEDQSKGHIENFLLQKDASLGHSFLEFLCTQVDLTFVHDTAVSYVVSYDSINLFYMNTLKNFIHDNGAENQLKNLEDKIREQDNRVAFFDDSELMQQQKGETIYGNSYRELYSGVDSIDIEDTTQNLEENKVFLVNGLIFNENKSNFSDSMVKKMLGDELYAQIAELKKATAQKVIDEDSNWMTNRDNAFSHFKVLSHGTGQAGARKEGVARSEEEALDAQAIVRAISNGPNGVGIRGEKATVGAFFNPRTNGMYGGVEHGVAVMFFTDDVIESHVSIATDPMGADGHVGIDKESKKYVQIPNRVLFNPQEGDISGVDLSHEQMADYILEMRHLLESDDRLSQHVFDVSTKFITENHPKSVGILQKIHTLLREDSYPESAILWARDYYLSLVLSDNESEKKLATVVEKIVVGLDKGVLEGDLRSHIDLVRLNWDSELEELAGKPLGFANLLSKAQEKMKQRQRRQFTTASRQFRGRERKSKEKLGVAKQHVLQVRSAEKYGDVSQRTVTDNLRTTRAFFMDSETNQDYLDSLTEVENYADYMKDVKESVLLRTFQEGVNSLDQVSSVIYQKYADKISICSSGSIGRGEVVISSDIDYLVLIDDRKLEEEDLTSIKRTLFKVGEHMNEAMKTNFNVRPDAGLANKDRQPIVLFSKVDSFTLDGTGSRQVLEPSEMLDISAADGKADIIELFKTRFMERAKELEGDDVESISLLDYMNSKVKEFDTLFNGGLSQLLSRDQLIDFKMQIQRIFNFHLYGMVAEHTEAIVQNGQVVPNETLDKIKFLADNDYIAADVSARFFELQLMLYRMRYRTDVLNSAQLIEIANKKGGRVDERAKIESKLDPQNISQKEYSRFLDLIVFFSDKLDAQKLEV